MRAGSGDEIAHIPGFTEVSRLSLRAGSNNQVRYNEVDFTRLKANVSNTGRFISDMTILACEA